VLIFVKNFTMLRKLLLLLLLPLLSGAQNDPVKIAFLADVHLQDLYGSFKDADYRGVINPADGKHVLLRSMESQLHSTRIFNENYFALIAALDDIAARGVKIVALPGDYTDDGQSIHLAGLQRILKTYEQKFGIQFFITTGNHDPVGPFARHAGKSDFLGEGGGLQPIFSNKDLYAPKPVDLPVVITQDIATMGYNGITEYLGGFGFLPKESYRYWATPFSNYNYDDYSLQMAVKQSGIENRQYAVTKGFTVPDASYVVEPVEGIWLLAIDGNTYLPKDSNGSPTDPDNYKGADLGYNNVLNNKAFLLKWVATIASEAKKHHKTLIAFSHYPMIDFNDGASPEIKQFMGKGKWQLDRVPVAAVAQQFADAGVTIHFGGHMHINDTGLHTTAKGNTLLNVQTPSLAAYIPAYKLLTIKGSTAEIETITIDEVPGFDVLFPLYEMEYAHLESLGRKDIWNKAILDTKTYHEFTDFHLKELVRLRFIPDDWHKHFAMFLDSLTGNDLLLLFNIQQPMAVNDVLNSNNFKTKPYKNALKAAQNSVRSNGLDSNAFNWSGTDLIYDFYRIRSADELAITDIGEERINQYKLIAQCVRDNKYLDTDHELVIDLKLFFSILTKFLNGDPANHFIYDLKTGAIQDVKP
jgi:3',5'-cyclic AMP phosphodiesterase CpdA